MFNDEVCALMLESPSHKESKNIIKSDQFLKSIKKYSEFFVDLSTHSYELR